ncbi:MAG TPA: hypothetical protein VFC63_21125, partial [Blastocatellia bacterium]|nr:hypothetical protein [Blastocatellia bacterium]
MKPKQWSRNSSYSERLLIWAGFISSIKALLIYALGIPIALVLAAHPAAAQSVLQGNPQQPINWVRTLVNLLVWVMVA